MKWLFDILRGMDKGPKTALQALRDGFLKDLKTTCADNRKQRCSWWFLKQSCTVILKRVCGQTKKTFWAFARWYWRNHSYWRGTPQFVTFIEDFSRWKAMYPFLETSNIFNLKLALRFLSELQTDTLLKSLDFDRDGDYIDSQFSIILKGCGINPDFSWSDTPRGIVYSTCINLRLHGNCICSAKTQQHL